MSPLEEDTYYLSHCSRQEGFAPVTSLTDCLMTTQGWEVSRLQLSVLPMLGCPKGTQVKPPTVGSSPPTSREVSVQDWHPCRVELSWASAHTADSHTPATCLPGSLLVVSQCWFLAVHR